MIVRQESLFPGNELGDGGEYSFQEFIENYTENLLRSYICRLRLLKHAPHPKELNDAVWETIELSPFEILILDSPLIQRLRHITQLGVVSYVYPSANHTRIEHSLGVMHQIDRLIAGINDSSDREVITSLMRKTLRIAALCHDVGHGFLSHVSENALQGDEKIDEIKFQFFDELNLEKASISEISAYYMLGSPSFKELFALAQQIAKEHDLPENTVELMQKAIIGQRIDDKIPLLNELISGPFDADKLDYMTRDAKMCGVPVVTDIPRLIKKVRAVEVAPNELPDEVARTVSEQLTYYITGIALSGGRTLDELMLGRVLLFDKIYRHQKVRAIESMIAGAIDSFQKATQVHPAEIPYLFNDEEFLSIDKLPETEWGRTGVRPENFHWMECAKDLIIRVKHRNLLTRAFAFAQSMPDDPFRHHQLQTDGIEKLYRETKGIEGRIALRDLIIDQLRVILNCLGQQHLLSPYKNLSAYIAINPPSASPQSGDIPRAYLIGSGKKISRFREDYAESRGWADAYLLTRDIGYVFAPKEISAYVYIASQTVIQTKYEINMPDSMLSYAKQDIEIINGIKRELEKKGYFKTLPHNLRPTPVRLEKADVKQVIASFISNTNGYQGPMVTAKDISDKGGLKKERVFNWLQQFEDDKFIESALELLKKIKLIGRSEIITSLEHFMRNKPEFKGACVCVLGDTKDSSSINTYYACDVQSRYELKPSTLIDAIISDVQHILFVDDFMGSGSQAISILESWLGVTPTVDLDEERSEPIPVELHEKLRNKKLGFVFAGALEKGPELFEARCKGLGLEIHLYVHNSERDLPKAFDGRYDNRFKERCEEIGRQLLKNNWAPDVIESRVLGYGNEALLIVFPYNTPTQTLTCLWKEGEVDGRRWIPLFSRRKKK